MTQHDKALKRLCTHPPLSDITWNELASVLKHLGYKEIQNAGSRRKFFHSDTKALIHCHRPHPSPCVDKGCLVDVREHLRIYGFIKD